MLTFEQFPSGINSVYWILKTKNVPDKFDNTAFIFTIFYNYNLNVQK